MYRATYGLFLGLMSKSWASLIWAILMLLMFQAFLGGFQFRLFHVSGFQFCSSHDVVSILSSILKSSTASLPYPVMLATLENGAVQVWREEQN